MNRNAKALKRIIWIIIVSACYFTSVYPREDLNKLRLTPEVTFLQEPPVVDGILDTNLKGLLPRRDFDFRFNLNILKGSAGSNYRLAYGTDFIYLFLEARADSFVCRDRGYQNGDGFIFAISGMVPGSDRSNENYVFGFSSQVNPEQIWAKKILWYYNGKVILSRLPDDVLFEYQALNGTIGFELIIPWSGVYPYHPYLSDGIGFNLWFMKAYPGRRFPNAQGIRFEVPSEAGLRKYKMLVFEEPALDQSSQAYMVLEKNHCCKGGKIKIRSSILSGLKGIEEFVLCVYNKDGKQAAKKTFNSAYQPGVSVHQFEFDISELVPGNYEIVWHARESYASGKLQLSVFPEFDHEAVLSRLENAKTKIQQGSYSSTMYSIREINRRINNLKYYEHDTAIINDLTSLLNDLKQMELGNDVYSCKSGIFRRAFQSELDGSLQPYKIQVPNGYDKSRKYPLLVFLHGSGRTDEDMFDRYHHYLSEGNFIQIAPNARGISHYYGTQQAQFDIGEAIRDVIGNYSIDTSNIVLSGFSMGGYGVYRTFTETPGRYKGLAVFSGEPKVGWFMKNRGGKYPNFLRKRNQSQFKDMPIFIYHGENDLNCPFGLTSRLVNKLESSGANVEFVFDDGAGHSSPKVEKTIAQYHAWLSKLIH